MILAMTNREIPKEWYHDPSLYDNNSYTVAMYCLIRDRIIDK